MANDALTSIPYNGGTGTLQKGQVISHGSTGDWVIQYFKPRPGGGYDIKLYNQNDSNSVLWLDTLNQTDHTLGGRASGTPVRLENFHLSDGTSLTPTSVLRPTSDSASVSGGINPDGTDTHSFRPTSLSERIDKMGINESVPVSGSSLKVVKAPDGTFNVVDTNGNYVVRYTGVKDPAAAAQLATGDASGYTTAPAAPAGPGGLHSDPLAAQAGTLKPGESMPVQDSSLRLTKAADGTFNVVDTNGNYVERYTGIKDPVEAASLARGDAPGFPGKQSGGGGGGGGGQGGGQGAGLPTPAGSTVSDPYAGTNNFYSNPNAAAAAKVAVQSEGALAKQLNNQPVGQGIPVEALDGSKYTVVPQDAGGKYYNVLNSKGEIVYSTGDPGDAAVQAVQGTHGPGLGVQAPGNTSQPLGSYTYNGEGKGYTVNTVDGPKQAWTMNDVKKLSAGQDLQRDIYEGGGSREILHGDQYVGSATSDGQGGVQVWDAKGNLVHSYTASEVGNASSAVSQMEGAGYFPGLISQDPDSPYYRVKIPGNNVPTTPPANGDLTGWEVDSQGRAVAPFPDPTAPPSSVQAINPDVAKKIATDPDSFNFHNYGPDDLVAGKSIDGHTITVSRDGGGWSSIYSDGEYLDSVPDEGLNNALGYTIKKGTGAFTNDYTYEGDPSAVTGIAPTVAPKLSTMEYIGGITGLFSLYYSFSQLFSGENIGQGLLTLAYGGWQTFTSALKIFKSFEGSHNFLLKMLGANPMLTTIAVVAIIALIAYLMSKGKKQQQELDAKAGDVPVNSNLVPPPYPGSSGSGSTANTAGTGGATTGSSSTRWYENLPSQSVFIILATVGSLAIGRGIALNPSDLKPDIQRNISTADVANIQKELSAKTKSSVTGDLAGKVFVQPGVGGANDQAVFFTKNTPDSSNPKLDTGYTVSRVVMNTSGNMIGIPLPNASLLPHFNVTTDKRVVPNADAAWALSAENALLNATNSNVTSAAGKAGGTEIAAGAAHGASPVYGNP